jgi:hypothetical protein
VIAEQREVVGLFGCNFEPVAVVLFWHAPEPPTGIQA